MTLAGSRLEYSTGSSNRDLDVDVSAGGERRREAELGTGRDGRVDFHVSIGREPFVPSRW